MFKILITIVVLIVAVLGLWWSGLLSTWVPSIPTYSQMTTPEAPATTTPIMPAQTQTQPAAVNDLPTQPNDASDAALTQDTAAINAQMSGLSTDSANAQGSTSDKPVTQEY